MHAARAGLEGWLSRLWWQPEPTRLAWLLWPLSMLYLGLWFIHRRTRPLAKALPVPVLVVGNHVVGGAGKTPTVIAIVQALQRAGHRPGVISRGHGRLGDGDGDDVHAVHANDRASTAGDEPLLIHRRCAVPVWVGQRRADVGRALCAAHPDVDVLVSDDGLQHAALVRNAELVVFDERGAGNGLMLPAGPLREPLPQTVPLTVPLTLPHVRRVLYTAGIRSTRLPGALALRSITSALPLAAWWAGDLAAATAAVPLSTLARRPLVAMAGIAAPEKFFGMLRAAGLTINALALPDHHAYDSHSALPWPADTPDVITTEKDAVKLNPQRMGSTRVWVVPLDFVLPQALVDELHTLLFPTRNPPP